MSQRPTLPIFETPDDARRYLLSLRCVAAGTVLLVAGVVVSLPLGSGMLPVIIATAGIVLVLAGMTFYLGLNARVWARHRPNDAWDWRTARGFYEGSFGSTVSRARAMARRR